MTNVRVLSLLSILGLVLLTAYRIVKGVSTDKFHTAWIAGLLILVVSFASDLNDGLGAALGIAVLIGVLTNSGINVSKLLTAKSAATAGGSGGQGSAPSSGPCPSGQVRDNKGVCVPLLGPPQAN
jgi:hypothetical protein